MIASIPRGRTRAQVNVDAFNRYAETRLAADDLRFPLIAPYERDVRPQAPLPLSWWERFDHACARITWLHVSIAGAIGALILVSSIVWSVYGGPR